MRLDDCSQLSPRTRLALHRAGIDTVEDLLPLKVPDLVRIRGIGTLALREICTLLDEITLPELPPSGWRDPKTCPEGVEVEALIATTRNGEPWRVRDYLTRTGDTWQRFNGESLTGQVIGWKPATPEAPAVKNLIERLKEE